MRFLASYNPNDQVGVIYVEDTDHEILFGLVNTNEWLPLKASIAGVPRILPECFEPDSELLIALDDAKALGRTIERELV